MAKITSIEDLRRLYSEPSKRSALKQLAHLDRHCRRFIELSPFFVLSSTQPGGPADVSPRGGLSGFVEVLDDRTILIPDRPGNNRLDTLTNLIANPEVGMLFFIPGVDETLRVNGTAEIRDDEELCRRFSVKDRLPKTVLRVTVREVFLHCAKAIMRAGLWDPQKKIERSLLPTIGQMLKEQIGLEGTAESQEAMIARYQNNLY